MKKLETFFENSKDDYDGLRLEPAGLSSATVNRRLLLGRQRARRSTRRTSSRSPVGPISRPALAPLGVEQRGLHGPRPPTGSRGTTMAARCQRGSCGPRSASIRSRAPIATSWERPAFPTASIAVPGGRFSVVANGVSPTNAYVQSVTLNGAPLSSPPPPLRRP